MGGPGIIKIITALAGLAVVWYLLVGAGAGIGLLIGIPWYILFLGIVIFVYWLIGT